jgi:acyl carrier protein phosphodiesterase
MNYLAHAWLSFRSPEILLGNLISDFVKGKKKFDYPPEVLRGILLHRQIDGFTDQHEETRKVKRLFSPTYGLYSGPLADIVFDHFLARDPNEFPDDKALMSFTDWTYRELESQDSWFPPRFGLFFRFMREQNWLYHYQFRSGIYASFEGLRRRAKYMPDSAGACSILDQHYESLQTMYDNFFPQLKQFAERILRESDLSDKA